MIATLVAILLCAVGAAAPEKGPPPSLGMGLPRLVLPDLHGQPYELTAVDSPVLVLNLWAFWCDTWKEQLPQLRELAAQQEKLGFRLVAVSVDGAWTGVFWEHCGAEGVAFPVLLDVRRQLATSFGLRVVPTVLVLDRQRRVRYVHEAYPGNPVVLQSIRRAASQAPQGE